MNATDWFEIGACAGLVAAWIAVRLGRHQRDRRRNQPAAPSERTFADGVRQLGEALDRQASTRPTPCPACSRADQAGLSASELHAGCKEQT